MFVIRFMRLFVETLEEVDGKVQPIWTPNLEDAKRFETREAAEEAWRQHQDNRTMRGAEVVPAGP